MAAKKKPASRASGAVKKGARAAKGAATKPPAKPAAGARANAKPAAKQSTSTAPAARAGDGKPTSALGRLKTGVTSLIGRLTGRGGKRAATDPGIEDAIADAPYDVSGVHKVKDTLARAQRGKDEDDGKRFSDPSLVMAAQGRGRRDATVEEPDESGAMSLFDDAPAPPRGSPQRREKIAALGRRRQAEAAAAQRPERPGLFDPPDPPDEE